MLSQSQNPSVSWDLDLVPPPGAMFSTGETFPGMGNSLLLKGAQFFDGQLSFLESTFFCNLCFLSTSGIYKPLSCTEFLPLQAKEIQFPHFKTCPHAFTSMQVLPVCNFLGTAQLWGAGSEFTLADLHIQSTT